MTTEEALAMALGLVSAAAYLLVAFVVAIVAARRLRVEFVSSSGSRPIDGLEAAGIGVFWPIAACAALFVLFGHAAVVLGRKS